MRLLIAVLLLAALPSAAAADTGVVPISNAEGSFAGLRAASPGRFADSGSTVAELGDVNGDGIADVAVGAPSVDAPGRTDAGVVYVVFGGTPLGRLDLRTAPGFRIVGPRQGANRPLPSFQPDGPPKGAMAGSAVAGAGDVNADGLADIVVGAPFAGRRGRAYSGSVYVVFGKRSTSTVDLQRLGRGGFRIDGPRRDAATANEVAGVGDVNGDGRADMVVSSGRVQVSTAYVVFGKASSAPVDLRRLRHGFAIRGGRREFGDVGDAVAGAGDFNGDGFADVAVGAPQSRAAKREGAGATFVVFGARRPGDVDVRALGTRGVEIDGEHEFANAGESLASLGDINGDGRGDLLIGASQVSVPDRSYAGAAYVVFGQSAAGRIDLLRPGTSAYRILGPATAAGGQARAGLAVAALGDVNGDGRRDMIIGAPGAARRCSQDEGAAYVVFSRADPAPLDLGDLGAGGYLIRGGTWTTPTRARPSRRPATGTATAAPTRWCSAPTSTTARAAARRRGSTSCSAATRHRRPRRDPGRNSSSSRRRCRRSTAAAGSKPASPWPRAGRGTTSTSSSRSPTRARSSRSAPPPCSFRSRAHRR